MTTTKKPVKQPQLQSWEALNEAIMEMDEAAAKALLQHELKGRKRLMFLLRIHSRINKLRAERERAELKELAQ